MPPGRSARAKAGASSSRGRSSRLAKSRSALAQRNAGWARPSASTTRTRERTPFLRSILGRDGDGDRIHVARDHRSAKSLGGGDGEDAGAGADIEDVGRALPLEQAIERDEAAARGGVMGGAEGKAGVDLEREAARGHLAPVVTAMHQEAAGAHRPPQAFCLRHPILRRQAVSIRSAPRPSSPATPSINWISRSREGSFSVMRRHLDLAGTALEQSDGQSRGALGRFKAGSDGLGDVRRAPRWSRRR